MNSNLPASLTSSPARSAAANAVESLSGSGLSTSRGGQESDAQAFARWMAQHQGAQASLNAPATPVSREVAQRAYQPPPSQASKVNLTVGAQGEASAAAAHPAQGAPSQAQANRQVNKAPAKQNAPKPHATDAQRQAAKPADKADAKDPAQAKEESLGKEVQFTTAQGDATAWVKELQPPSDLAAGDPAAMLAWLASLSQAGTAAPEATATGEQAEGAVSAGPKSGLSSPEGDRAGLAGRHWPGPGGTAAQQDASAGGDHQSGKGADERAGALTLEGMTALKSEDATASAGTVSFNAMMGREIQRTNDAASSPATRHYTGSLQAPVDSPQFTQALADRVGLWVTGPAMEGPMTAELRLNPAEMGPVHIRIELDGKTAQVDFAAATAETRQAIEDSLSLLSSSLSEAGLSLSGGGVSDQPQQQGWSQAQMDQQRDGQGGGQGRRGAEGGARGDGTNWRADDRDTLQAARPLHLREGRAGGLDLYA